VTLAQLQFSTEKVWDFDRARLQQVRKLGQGTFGMGECLCVGARTRVCVWGGCLCLCLCLSSLLDACMQRRCHHDP
jgi:hypothetical protein